MTLKFGAICASAVLAISGSVQQAQADDATASIALTWVFGKGAAVGAKIFSNDSEGEVAATLGVDYLFNSGAWRPNVGAAYIDDDVFIDFSLGFGGKEMDFGVGIGPIDSSSDSTPSDTTPPIDD